MTTLVSPTHRRFLFGVGAVLLSAPLLAFGLFEWTHLERYPVEPARIALAEVPTVAPFSGGERPWVEIVDGAWVQCERANDPVPVSISTARSGASAAVSRAASLAIHSSTLTGAGAQQARGT